MCVTFINIDNQPNSTYKLILLNNRDENLDRPTSAAKWERGILAGRDEQKECRGTWLGMDGQGRIANLLSITLPSHQRKLNTSSRGKIPLNFLQSKLAPYDYCRSISKKCKKHDGFQLLCLQRNQEDCYELCGIVNRLVDKIEPITYTDGLHGFGNCAPHTPFLKVERGAVLMEQVIEEAKEVDLKEAALIGRLLQVATDRYMCYPDEQLRKQIGRSGELCKYRSSLYVQYPDGIRYGTRSHTIILVDRANHVTFYEKRMIEAPKRINDAKWATSTYHFDLC